MACLPAVSQGVTCPPAVDRGVACLYLLFITSTGVIFLGYQCSSKVLVTEHSGVTPPDSPCSEPLDSLVRSCKLLKCCAEMPTMDVVERDDPWSPDRDGPAANCQQLHCSSYYTTWSSCGLWSRGRSLWVLCRVRVRRLTQCSLAAGLWPSPRQSGRPSFPPSRTGVLVHAQVRCATSSRAYETAL